MLETYITPILMSYVDKYIKNLKPSDLNLSLWGGDVSLTNLELNLHALEKELNFPVTFLSGKIHELHIHVPWTKLYYEPAVITINTIECILKLKENSFPSEGADESTEIPQADIKPSTDSAATETESEKALPPGYVQSLLNKVIYNLTVKVNNFILKYVEDDIVLSINVKSAEFHSANENWVKAFVDVAAPDWILHKMCNISDLTVCLDRRNASGVIEMYQDPLAYRCNLSCRMQVYYDKEGYHLPLEKNLSVYCECLEVSITDQQLPLLLRLLKLGLSLYYGTLDLPGCEPSPHFAKDLINKTGGKLKSSIITQLPGSFGPAAETELSETGWLSWAYSMVPSLSGEQKGPDASLSSLVSRFGVYISQASLSFKITEPISEGNFLGAQRFVFKPILTLEASGVAQEMITKGSSFFDFQMGVTSVTGWIVDTCVCRNQNKGPSDDDDDGNAREPEEELFLRVGGKDTNVNKGIAFLKGSLFDLESSSVEQPPLTANAEEFIRKNSEANVLSRFGAMFFEYLYAMEIENDEDSGYYESAPAVKEESYQRIIVGPSMLEVTSGVVHRMEMVMKLAEDDANSRKEKDEIFYDDFVEDQLLSGNVSHRHLHVTVLDSSLVIFMADHVKTAQTQSESAMPSEGTLSEIQEEEKKSSARDLTPTTGCVLQVERLDFQKTSPMFPVEMVKLLKEKRGSKTLLQHANSNIFVKVFGFQIGVSKHDIDVEDPMILNIVPACNMSLFAKQSLVSRQLDDISEIEARFELASLSLNITKPQLVLLQDIHQSWTNNTLIIQNSLSGSSLIQDVFHPSAKQGGKIPVLIEAFVQDIKVQLHLTSEEISSSGSIGSVKATVMSLTGETAENTPVLFGPLITEDIYNGECFKSDKKRSFKMETLEPWLAFTLKIPMVSQDGNVKENRAQTAGAILLKCNGTVISLDPVLFTWLAYYPRMSPVVNTSSRNKQLRKVISHTRSASAVTPRKKSYARGHISPSHSHKKQKKMRYSQQRKRRDSVQERSQDFDGWVWERLPLLASVVIQVDVESVVFFAPSTHLAYDDLSGDCYDIPGNFIRQLNKRDSTLEPLSGLVLSLPSLKVRSSGHQDLAICHDILRHPLTLPPRDQPETLPWTLTADHTSVFTVWIGGDGKEVEVYFVLNPMCCRAMLASAKTSHPGNMASQNEAQKATLDFVLHTDFNPLTVNCSKKQVDLLFQLYSNAVQLTSSVSANASSNENELLLPARSITSVVTGTGRSARRTTSMTSSSGFDVIDDESLSSESTPKPSVTSLDTPKMSPSLIHVSLWVQWTLPKLSFNIFGNDNGSDLRITTELEDWSASFDYQNGHFKAQCKVGNLSITHYKLGSSGQWITGSGGGTILARQDSLSSSLSKVRDSDSDNSDPGPHGFLYVEYTASSLAVPSFKGAFGLDDVFRNSFGYSQDVHVTIQPFDFILWCPLLYTVATVFHTFTSLQSDTVGKCESQGAPLQDPSVEPHQSLTSLPEVNLKLRGFRVVVPSRIESGKLGDEKIGVRNSDLFTIQASSLLVSSQVENPTSRLVVDKKLSKALTASARNRRGSAAEKVFGDTQYKVEVKGLRVWSGCWNELCRMLPNQDTTRIERDLLEQNPALEWNTYSGQDRTSALVIPVVSDLDIKGIIAPPIVLTTSSKSQCWRKPIFGLSLEVNLTTDVEGFFSKSQVILMQTILKDNIMNSDFSNDDVISSVSGDDTSTLSYPPEVATFQEKLDSGIGSECSHGNRLKRAVQSRETKLDVQEMECLFTAGRVSVFVYEHSSTGDARMRLVPIVGVSLVQPSFNCTGRTDCNTVQISSFDLSLAKCKSTARNSDDIQLVPSSEDYDVIWFRTGDGSPDKRTELSPSFVNFTCKLYPSSPADLKLDFGRPIWIDIDLGMLERLKNFVADLSIQQTTLDGDHESGSKSELVNIVRSVAVSTDYVAITATAGQDREVDPAIKTSCSSMNLGVSLKADDREDFCQRVAANLHLCALSIATSIDDKFRSFLLPYDASIDMELFCNSPAVSQDTCCVSAVKETFIWLDSGLLQVNFGQEHLRCINVFTQNILTFINTHVGESADNVNVIPPIPDPTVHRSEDDLRTGPFKYVTSAAAETRPNPYEIVFSDEGLPTMTWRYPEPRALCGIYIIPIPFTTFTSYPSPVKEEDRILPCILRYWDNIQKSYVEHSTFNISENVSVIVPVLDPVEGPLSEVIAASEWQVVANIAMTSDDDECSSDDEEYSMLTERSNIPSPISATSLAACMKVDSMFCSNLVPKLSLAASVNIMQFTVYNHMENMQNAIAKRYKGYTLQEEIPTSQEFLRVMVENSTIIIKSWPTNTLQCLLWSNAHADVLDYRELRWKSLLSPVDLTLAFIKNEIRQKGNKTSSENFESCSLDVSCGDVIVDASQSRIHTLSAGLLAWQNGEHPVFSHFIICNNTNHAIKFGQDGTEETILLRSKELTFYSWTSLNDLCHQKLHLSLDGENRWCEPFGIDSAGVLNRAIQYSVHTATLIIEIRKKSGLQREVIIHSSHVVQNYTSHDIEVQLLQNPAVTQVTSPALQVLHNIIVPSQSTSPSYVISHGGLAGMRVRMRGETTWSGTLPIEDQMPNYKQHCVVQMLGTKEFKNFYIWYNAVCVDSLIGQIEISFSPLFIIKNYLSQTIQLTAVSASGDVTTTHDALGEAQEHQLFDLPPDSWHYVTFKLPDAKISSNPSVPLNTTLHELTDKVKRSDEGEEMSDTKWPYSSNSRKTSSGTYVKPVESTLVRHVQSSQDDSLQSEREPNKSDPSCVELQCQILNKWKKLRSILLEVKPWALFENKSCVTLHLKDEIGSVFDVKPGQVISPTKLKSFRVGVVPEWLDEIRWSDSISLVDGDHPQNPVSSNSLQQYGRLNCVVIVPSPSGRKLCSLLLMSCIAKGIRVITLQESIRIVCTALSRPLFVQPVIVNDVTTKLKETAFNAHIRMNLKTGNHTDIVSQGIPFWDISSEKGTLDNITIDSLRVLVFGLPKSPDIPNASPSIQWSRPARIQDGIVRQCVSVQTSDPDLPLPIVVITLIENGLTKVIIIEDQVPRMLLTNQFTTPIQFGQCPSNSDKQNAKGTKLSGRDLVVSENLEQYTTIPRLEGNSSVYYEPPEMRDGFLTKRPQKVPKIRVQILKQADIKEVVSEKQGETRAKPIYMPQGWSDAIDVNKVGKTAYNLPGNCRLHVNVVKKTSFLTHVVFSETFTVRENTSQVRKHQQVDNVKVICNASNFSICLHDESSWAHPTAVFHLNLQDLTVSAIRSDNLRTRIELCLAEIQMDNQMTDDFYHFPVVLLPLEHESRSTKRKEKRTIKSLLSLNLDFSSSLQKTHVHLLSIQLEPLSVFVEDTFLYRLAGMLDSFILPESDRPVEPCGNSRISSDNSKQFDENVPTVSEGQTVTHDHLRSEGERTPTQADSTKSLSERSTISPEDIRALTLASAVISPVLIDQITIEPVYVAVTFHASVKLFVSANHTPLFFSRFEMTSLFTDPAFLAQLLAVHYGYSALLKVGWVVGSLDIIGSPASFLRSLGQGVADFFYLPYDGLTRGPTAFVTGMTRGVSSFMSHISAGALTSVTNLASSISRNLDRLSFDEQHVRLQEQERADGVPRRVISGFTHGLSGFFLSVLSAVAGVADQPLQGLFRAENARDATSCLITGVGKGLIGVVTKPLGGAMELVSQTGQGILQGTGLGEMPLRLCVREDTLGSSCNLKYLWKLLESKSSTDIFTVTASVVVSGNTHFDATLVMSCDSMMFLDTDDDTILSAFVLKQVDMREDPQHPRAVIVEHSVTGADTISEASSFAELSPSNIGPSRDVTNRSSRQSFSENEAVNLTLFMDPVYLRPLLSRFKLLKSGYW